jgi:hypothetical protein
MTSLYYDYNPNIDLRWDNDMYGQFENKNSDVQDTNTKLLNKKCRSTFNFKLLLKRLLWFILIIIIFLLFVKLFKLYDSGSQDYPYIDLVNNKYYNYM